MKRSAALAMVASAIAMPEAAMASRADDKKKFIAQCDESISVARLAGAPHKFIGKKVDLHGVVGPPMQDSSAFNLDSNDRSSFVIVIGDARSLEAGQSVRVLGVVVGAQSGATTDGGSGTFATVQSRFIE